MTSLTGPHITLAAAIRILLDSIGKKRLDALYETASLREREAIDRLKSEVGRKPLNWW